MRSCCHAWRKCYLRLGWRFNSWQATVAPWQAHFLAAAWRGLTPRSSGRPTAWHAGLAAFASLILCGQPSAPCRWAPLSSNVRPRKYKFRHRQRLWRFAAQIANSAFLDSVAGRTQSHGRSAWESMLSRGRYVEVLPNERHGRNARSTRRPRLQERASLWPSLRYCANVLVGSGVAKAA